MAELGYAGRNVVAGRGLLAVPGRGMVPCQALHAGDVCIAAAGQEADVILAHGEALEWWGLPGRLERRGAADQLAKLPFVMDAASAGWQAHSEGWRLRLKPPNGGRWYSLVLLPYDAGRSPLAGPWAAAATFSDLVLALSRFAHTTGHAWRDSVGRTAERIILSTHPRDRGGVLLDRAPQIPDPALDGGLEQPLTWRRPLDGAERGCGWIHHYDANAQYLAAWAVTELGFGEPRPAAEFIASMPGLWQLGGFELPAGDPLLPPAYDTGREWVTTPTLLRIIELTGAVPPIRDGWVWPQSSRYLRAAGELLRDGRAQLLEEAGPAARIALDGLKALYRVETGRFNMAARDERSGWHRPDWGHAIRATARVNLHRRICGTDKRPALAWPPFAIATDGLLITSDEADPVAWAAKIGLPVGGRLGEFSVEGSARLTPERIEALEAASGVGKLFAAVKGWCGE